MDERLIELGLSEPDSLREPGLEPSETVELAAFSARLLTLIADTVVESDTLRTSEFRGELGKYRHRLANSLPGDTNTSLVAGQCLRVCRDYLTRARKYLLERESEFAEVIDIMCTGLGNLAGEADSFNVRLLSSSERLNRLTEIEDIRELRKQISHEVHAFTRVVVERQKQDEFNYAKLSKDIEVLRASLVHTREQAALDPLTQIPNRGTFDKAIERWVTTHKQNRKPFILAICDLDNFKQINDTHGHQVGDRVLFCASQWFAKYVRSSDFLARYGGEEFVMLLTECQLPQAEAKFTELLAKIAECNYQYQKDNESRTLTFTVSCGLAEFALDETAEDVLRRADEALLIAKKTGKNRVVVSKKQKSLWKTLKPFMPLARG